MSEDAEGERNSVEGQVMETHNGLTGLIAEAARVRHPKRRDEAACLDCSLK